VGANLNNRRPEDFATAKKMVTQYKQIREIVQRGSLYRLISPQNGSEQSVTESVSEDQRRAVVFVFLHSSQMLYPFPRIYLRGSNTDAMFRIAALDGKLPARSPAVASDAFWMPSRELLVDRKTI
jgi:alpha-galactosidase